MNAESRGPDSRSIVPKVPEASEIKISLGNCNSKTCSVTRSPGLDSTQAVLLVMIPGNVANDMPVGGAENPLFQIGLVGGHSPAV
jgi:hypothetical protein